MQCGRRVGGEAQRGSLQQASVGGGGGQKARSLEVSSKRTWEDSNLQRSVLHARGIKEIREATGPGAFLNAGGKNIDHQHQAGPKGPTDKRIPPAHGKNSAVAVAVFRGLFPAEALIKRKYVYIDGPRALPTNITKTAPPEAKEWEAVGFILSQAMLFLLWGATSRKRSLKLPQTTQSDLSWAIFFWKNPLPHPHPSPRHWSKNSTKSVWPWRQASGLTGKQAGDG